LNNGTTIIMELRGRVYLERRWATEKSTLTRSHLKLEADKKEKNKNKREKIKDIHFLV